MPGEPVSSTQQGYRDVSLGSIDTLERSARGLNTHAQLSSARCTVFHHHRHSPVHVGLVTAVTPN
jgi:hypothetical protein